MVLIFISNERLDDSNLRIPSEIGSLAELVPLLLSSGRRQSTPGFLSNQSGEAEMQTDLETPRASEGGGSTGATVLIVDDEDAARQLCSDIAIEAGLRLRTAGTAEE